jgi:CheY-like chemotaxis protein
MPTVLVVDDHLDTCQLLVRLLELIGHPATCVVSGRAALEYVRGAGDVPALVILDVMMPDMNGFDVLRALRADPRSRDVPVVMHSARDDDATRALATRDGAQGYFVKTQLGVAELRGLVERFVGNRPERN